MTTYIQWLIKGAAMGMADIVPGVSGGTLAFILGIYERFINALTAFNLNAVKLVFRGQFKALWEHIDGTFLLCVFGGILLSIFTLANLITYLLTFHPVPLWAFFNGLIIASFPLLIKNIEWSPLRALVFVAGVVFAVIMTTLTPIQYNPSPWLFFIAGFIAICAMILPGISGSFLLLIMGMYAPMTQAVSELNISVLVLFALGCASGLMVFSRILKWALQRAHNAMLAFLSGIVLGALFRIWPWQFETKVMTPNAYADMAGDHYLGLAIFAFLLGAAVIHTLLRLESIFKENKQ